MQSLGVTLLFSLSISLALGATRVGLEAREVYLNYVYQRVKERPLRNGELNLTPDENDGFANTVRGLPEVEEGRITGTTRKMQFQNPSLKPTERVICTKLVINLPSTFSEDGEITLYKQFEGSDHYQLLDKAQVPTYGTASWFELTVGHTGAMKGVKLQIELTHNNMAFLQGVEPMLVMYTYVEPSLPSFITKRSSTGTVGIEATGLADLDKRNLACSKHSVTLHYSQLRWLGDNVTITAPNSSRFKLDYCYGHCLSPLDVRRLHDDTHQDYDKRARILEVLNQMNNSRRLTPPPCCIPLHFTASELVYEQYNVYTRTSFPVVTDCGCRG